MSFKIVAVFRRPWLRVGSVYNNIDSSIDYLFKVVAEELGHTIHESGKFDYISQQKKILMKKNHQMFDIEIREEKTEDIDIHVSIEGSGEPEDICTVLLQKSEEILKQQSPHFLRLRQKYVSEKTLERRPPESHELPKSKTGIISPFKYNLLTGDEKTMECPKCRAANRAEAKFCKECGAKIRSELVEKSSEKEIMVSEEIKKEMLSTLTRIKEQEEKTEYVEAYRNYKTIAETYRNLGDIPNFKEFMTKGAECLAKYGDKIDDSSFYNDAAEIYKNLGDIHNLRRYKEKAIAGSIEEAKKYEEEEEYGPATGAYHTVAEWFEDLGKPQEAIQYYMKGLHLYELYVGEGGTLSGGDCSQIGSLLMGIGDCYKKLSLIDDALAHWRRAVENFERALELDEIKPPPHILCNDCGFLLKVGTCYEKLDDYERAIQYFLKAKEELTRKQADEEKQGFISPYGGYGELLEGYVDKVEGKIALQKGTGEVSKRYFDRALSLFEKVTTIDVSKFGYHPKKIAEENIREIKTISSTKSLK